MKTQLMIRFFRTARPFTVLSGLALTLLPWMAATPAAAQTIVVSNLWSISTTNGRPYLTNASASSYTERGVAYNRLTSHAYIVSRQGGVKVAILDGDTGDELGYLNVTGVSGGTFALSTIGVADDGSIYAANLTTGSATSPYRIYRWSDESAAPIMVYASNPSVGANNNRYGESFDIRGGGVDTEIIASANGAPIVAIFKPTDESLTAFNSYRIDVTGIGNADLTKGIGFGSGASFYGKNNGVSAARYCSYDITLGTAALVSSYTLVSGIAPIDYDPVNNVLACVETANAAAPHNLRVYDLAGGTPALIHTSAFPPPGTNNGNLVGQVQIAGDRIFAIDTQNGVMMSKISVDTSVTPPAIISAPTSQTVVQGGYVTLSAAATGTRPLSYQWAFNGTPIDGATTNTLSLTNVTPATGGDYTITVSNSAGSTSSPPAAITITPTALTDAMRVLWKLAPGARAYLTADNTQRGLAWNPVSGHVLLVSRAPTNGIHVLESETGAHLYSLDVGGGLIAGGSAGITLSMIACTESGEVFAANLTTDGTSTTKLRIYGWLDDGELAAPYLAWEGDPGNGVANRWGDSFDARGFGAGLEILLGSRNDKVVSIIRPGLGMNSTPDVIQVADAEPGNFGLSIKWGEGSTFYGKSGGSSLRHVAYDIATLSGTTIAVNSQYPSVDVIGFDPVSGLLAGLSREVPDTLRLLNGHSLVAPDLTLDTEFFLTDNDNPNGTGQIAMGNRRVFALQSNNGIIGAAVAPALRLTRSGSSLVLTWTGSAILQSTPSLDQPFVDLPGTVSGHSVDLTTTTGHRFFRLKE
jgi:hypothetical protein